MRLRFSVQDSGVEDDLLRLAEATGDLRAAMREAGFYMKRETQLNFVRQSDPEGKPWAALKAGTLRRKKTSAILRETGTLAAGIQMRSTTHQATVTSTAGSQYGIFHQKGTSKMVARPYIGIGDRHVPKIKTIIETHIQRALG